MEEKKKEIEKIKKLLDVADVLEKYDYYLLRRSVGLIYLTISASISLILVIFLGFIEIVPPSQTTLFIGAVILIMIIATYFAVNGIFGSLKIYKIEVKKGKSVSGKIWGTLNALFFVILLLGFLGIIPEYDYPFIVQIIVGLGNLGNYYDSKKNEEFPGKIEKEYLVFSAILLATAVLIPLSPEYGWFIVTMTALLGSYIFGLYILFTSDNVFEQ